MNNQQERVLIALGRTTFARTPDALSAELGYPKASIRRTVNELRKKDYAIIGPTENTVMPGEYYLQVTESNRRRAAHATMGQTETPIEASTR